MRPVYTLEMYREKGQWRWRFRAANKKIMAQSSEGYVRFEDALHCAAVVTGMPMTAYDLALDTPSARFSYDSEDREVFYVNTAAGRKASEEGSDD